MKKPFESLSEESKERLVREEEPGWSAPMLATLTDDYFNDESWIYERKLDGERSLAFRRGSDVRLLSRNRILQNSSYPELVDAVKVQQCDDFVIDGEVVAFEGGNTSFERLQGRMHLKDPRSALETGISVYYYVFDIMYLEGYDVCALPLRDRKSLLRRAVKFDGPLRLTVHRNQDGLSYFHEACSKGWEGVIAKKADSAYVHKRSRYWLKFKCVYQQEMVIGGFTDPKGSRHGFGALLVGYYEKGDLRYAGKVGTGFDEQTLYMMGRALSSIETENSPFSDESIMDPGVHWVEPVLVAEVEFSEWTRSGRLRHPRFVGLRRDKPPREVVRERPRGQQTVRKK